MGTAGSDARGDAGEPQPSRRGFLAAALLGAAGCAAGTGAGAPGFLTWGGPGLRNGQFRRPRAITVTSTNEVYVIDRTARVQVFSSDGQYIRGWHLPPRELGTPTAVAEGVDGRILIPDTHRSVVLEYTPEGEQLEEWGAYGTGQGQFIYPTGIAQAEDGTYFITEYGFGDSSDRLHVYDAARQFVRWWGGTGTGPGEFARPMAVRLRDRRVYISDTANHRVQVFNREGGHEATFGEPGRDPGATQYPYDIGMAPDGGVFVCEYGNNRVSRFTADLQFDRVYGGAGREPGRFSRPRGIACGAGGSVFVADTENDRIQRFTPHGAA